MFKWPPLLSRWGVVLCSGLGKALNWGLHLAFIWCHSQGLPLPDVLLSFCGTRDTRGCEEQQSVSQWKSHKRPSVLERGVLSESKDWVWSREQKSCQKCWAAQMECFKKMRQDSVSPTNRNPWRCSTMCPLPPPLFFRYQLPFLSH